jgi:bleomycin hydrolase
MKNLLFIVLLITGFSFTAFCQVKYEFTTTTEVKTTSVKNQFRTGTCWSFSTISFVETELLRKGKGELNLSEMYPVHYTYYQRAIDYVRYHGHLNFDAGAQSWDLINGIVQYGFVPEEVYPGLEYGESVHTHGELNKVLTTFLEGVIENKNGKLSLSWKNSFNGILDSYLGKMPEKFTYKGKEYTPQSFAEELDFHPEEYVSITSFTHHPYYKPFVFESPDNWSHQLLYNVKLDDLITIITSAIEKGYSVQWSSDFSEKGLNSARGIGIVPAKDYYLKSKEEQEATCVFIEEEKIITAEMRQEAFDNYSTTDDHAMQIVGLAKDQNGKRYFKIKNSHGTSNDFQGYLFVSEAFVRYKTMSILLHKNAIPDEIGKKFEGFK